MGNIKRDILHGAQLVSVLFVGLQLLGTESASVGACCVYLIAFLGQFHHGVAGVQTTRECYYNFLLAHICVPF